MNDNVNVSQARILLAEDDPSNRKVTQLMLGRLGYEADAVTNGLEVLQALDGRTYDLILMDILMPKMDGVAAAEEIRRRWPASSQPKIIAYTAYVLPDNGCKNFLRNMDGYLFKPVKMEDLRTAIEANLWVLDRRRRWLRGGLRQIRLSACGKPMLSKKRAISFTAVAWGSPSSCFLYLR